MRNKTHNPEIVTALPSKMNSIGLSEFSGIGIPQSPVLRAEALIVPVLRYRKNPVYRDTGNAIPNWKLNDDCVMLSEVISQTFNMLTAEPQIPRVVPVDLLDGITQSPNGHISIFEYWWPPIWI